MDKHDNKQLFLDVKGWGRDLEKEMQRRFSDLGPSTFDIASKKPFFGIDTPPPYPSGRPWHLGAAAQYSQIDAIARSERMLGREVLFPIGMDRNGLPVERYTEKKYDIRMRETDREKFIGLCRGALDDLQSEMVDILKAIGFSADFDKMYRTDSDEYRTLTQATFIKHWKDGMIYRGNRPTNYCVECGTTIADAEIEYKDLSTKLAFFNFDLKGSKEKITIASTRPELLGACKAIIVNPEDERYKSFIGSYAMLPIYKTEVKIMGHSSAKPEFGSGAVMVCSYGDYNDVLLFKELGLEEKIIIGENGRLTNAAGKLAGLTVNSARKEMLKLLQEDGALQKVQEISHRTPTCDRSKNPIEIIPMDEYYMKIKDLKEKVGEITDKLKFVPEQHKQILFNWMKVAMDWPISRRRFYGTEIPLWYCKKCNETYVPQPGKYYKPWKDDPPSGAACEKCESKEFYGDARTFDTWMDSSVSSLFVTKYLTDPKFYSKTYPLTIRAQGVDIVRTWLYYSIIRCFELTKTPPWSNVWIGGMGLDERGEKMSKSKGNGVDPMVIIERYGSDAFRFWASSEASPGSNFLFSEQRIMGAQKFLTKLWNVAKFIKEFGDYDVKEKPKKLLPTDKWVLEELSAAVKDSLDGYRSFNFFIPSNRMREFTWNIFAPHYIEMVKARAYGKDFSKEERLSAIYSLNQALRAILLVLAPICPFITESIWTSLYSEESVHKMEFPRDLMEFKEMSMYSALIIDFNTKVWGEKRTKGISLRDQIELDVPSDLEMFDKDLKAMHNLK